MKKVYYVYKVIDKTTNEFYYGSRGYSGNPKSDKEIGYVKITKDRKLIRHGIWKSYCKRELKMSALYKDGKMVWLETDKIRKITHNEIIYLRNLGRDNTVIASEDELAQ